MLPAPKGLQRRSLPPPLGSGPRHFLQYDLVPGTFFSAGDFNPQRVTNDQQLSTTVRRKDPKDVTKVS